MILILTIVALVILTSDLYFDSSYSLGLQPPSSKLDPIVEDSELQIEEVANGLELPTTMAFIGYDDFLILEKEKGTVRRVVNGTLLEEPILNLNVSTEIDQGLLGIAFYSLGKERSMCFYIIVN